MARMNWRRVGWETKARHPDTDPPQRTARIKGRTHFTARYAGVCWVCKRAYPKGTLIRAVAGSSSYRHARC